VAAEPTTDTTVARPRSLAPPATWDATDHGPGSPSGSVRPPDSVGTVDAPPRQPRRGATTALLAALFGAVVGTAGTIAVVGPGDDASVAAPAPATGEQVQAPTIDVEGESRSVVPAVAAAVTPSVVRIDILGTGAGGAEEELGLGSGVVYRSDGFIITNNHVVEQADGLRVKLSDGEVFDADVVGTDPLNDLAVLKIDATGLPAVNLRAEDEPVVGETAIAIGSPFGLDASVTAGVISATGRDITVPPTGEDGEPLPIPAVIQTDAAINPGNSGGALVDEEGRLLGINTAILSGTGGSQGVGFAIPVAQATTSADQLIETGEVQYPLLGVTGTDVTREIAERFEIDAGGALIDQVTPDSGAADAGLQRDDIIIAVEDQEITSMSDLVVTIRRFQPGDSVEVTYVRDGQRRTVDVTLGDRDDFVE
jgi:S1-C subfamily serine protease